MGLHERHYSHNILIHIPATKDHFLISKLVGKCFKDTNYFHAIYPSSLKEINFFRCKQLITHEFEVYYYKKCICNYMLQNYSYLKYVFHPPCTHNSLSYVYSCNIIIQHQHHSQSVLYGSTMPSVFSKDMHSLDFDFLTGPSYPQILHFCRKDHDNFATHFIKFFKLQAGKEQAFYRRN